MGQKEKEIPWGFHPSSILFQFQFELIKSGFTIIEMPAAIADEWNAMAMLRQALSALYNLWMAPIWLVVLTGLDKKSELELIWKKEIKKQTKKQAKTLDVNITDVKNG